ncbi:retropepsin-like aspartic protease family protein [Thiohalophilus sp.]|uniref:retropepsin-like aspartic protease family protein n=1 Tax=Thiohalophilus sp. TaxID=3028392 RepID=UPI002ACE2D33|nr:TIGR02281 family clan AA aspartic protease [Thiohalophilus sp.]MDZ7663425.1 TIGR02281 family clan AA aspartic protease [Thiohalophilus sp.]
MFYSSRQWLLTTLMLAGSLLAHAADLQIQGLFRDMAILEVDGVQYTLRPGDTTPQGIKLIRADSEQAVLEIDGRQETYQLGSEISTAYSRPEMAEAVIYRRQDMYFGSGSINNQSVSFIVDTGASAISMNEAQARRLGIDFRVVGDPIHVSTANGLARAYKVNLDRVKVGDIQLHNVTGIVHEGGSPRIILLGMSFLGQLEMQRDGERLVLKKKW